MRRKFYTAFQWREGLDKIDVSQHAYGFLLNYIKDKGYQPIHSELKYDNKCKYGEWIVDAKKISNNDLYN